MKIAIPTNDDILSAHFGHCKTFVLVDVDLKKKRVLNKVVVDAPRHEPGVLPKFLADQGANAIIAGGMGNQAICLFEENNIEVVLGAPEKRTDEIISDFLNGTLKTDGNLCDH